MCRSFKLFQAIVYFDKVQVQGHIVSGKKEEEEDNFHCLLKTNIQKAFI